MTETPRLTEAQIAEIERAASTRVASGRRIGADPDLLAAIRQLRADLSDSRSYAELQAKSGQNLLRRIRECAIAVGDVTPETAHTLTGDYAPALVGIVQFIADDREKLQTDLAALRASKAQQDREVQQLKADRAEDEADHDKLEARIVELERNWRAELNASLDLAHRRYEAERIAAEARLTTAREALREYFDAKRDYEANVAAHEGWIERNIRLTTAEHVLTALAAAAGEGETP